MSDLFQGQTMTEAYKFISAGTAHTFSFHFQPDKVSFYNLTAWTATAGKLPISVWFRDQTTAAHAYQQQVIDSSAGASFNFLNTATNGFTVANTAGGVSQSNFVISNITAADPVEITTSVVNPFQTNQLVRITDLGDDMPTPRGMSQLNNNRYMIKVIDTTHFTLADPLTGEPIDGTNFETYVSGGRVCLESHVISLNNPQQPPYQIIPYVPNPYRYDPITYQLTAGTAVMGANSDEYLIEVIKYGQVYDLGDLLV